ncbi:hypothetical protein [Deinococcus radiophilus]|uniref:Uncharacterized protein n=1 Tax=Deinococcus radiophilus TaxID=32062 RepID=A0A3S0I797_9DEIO|nr:hypothetical protein [Deinococcus radiophilus]RTR29070.1 hypothetical protein EJ104_04290 [Deinococcus radiophilus]UFA49656.1 hypothetical protein LMT64_07050 [Deinococcus radiophilus]
MKYVNDDTPAPPANDRLGVADWLKIGLAVLMVLFLLGLWRQDTDAEPGQPSQSAVTEAAQHWEGSGELNTDPFRLDAQNYSVSVTTGSDCFYAFDLRGLDGESHEGLARAQMGTQESNIYQLPPGEYYLVVTTGPAPKCPWSVDLTPR